MKSLILGLLALLAWSTSGVQAGEISYQDNRFDTLHYRNPAGSFFLAFSVVPILHYETTSFPSGIAAYDDHLTGFSSGASLSYGVSDSLLVSISESYGSQTRTAVYVPNGTQASASSSGLSDPTLDVNYRYWGAMTGQYFASAFFDLAPALGNAVIATSTTDGNNLAGSWGAELGTHLYWVFGINELALTATLTRRFRGNFSTASASLTETADPFWVGDLAVDYRVHLDEHFFLNAGVSLIPAHSVQYSITSASPSTEQDSYPWWVSESVELGWLATPSLLFRAALSNAGYMETVTQSGYSPYNYSVSVQQLELSGAWVF